MPGRPPYSMTIEVIPKGPMATAKKKWAAVAKVYAVNSERARNGWPPIEHKDFCKWTGISEEDYFNAEAHKEFVDTSLSIAKAQSVMWFRNELPKMQKSAESLRDMGEDKNYLTVTMELANMLKFKDYDLSGLEETEVRGVKETIEEILTILTDDVVKGAITNEEGLVPQKLIPALVNASFKRGSKNKAASTTQLSDTPQANSQTGPDQSLDTFFETEDRPLQ